MSNLMQKSMVMATVATLLALGLPSAYATQAQLDCKLRFSLSGWSAIYKHAEGRGIVTCADGSSMNVAIEAKGGGLTVGKSRIDGGKGKFSDVRTIDDVLGSYVNGEAHVGVVKSGTAQLLTKGTVSLALAGAGEGVDVGIDVGEMTLKRAERRESADRH